MTSQKDQLDELKKMNLNKIEEAIQVKRYSGNFDDFISLIATYCSFQLKQYKIKRRDKGRCYIVCPDESCTFHVNLRSSMKKHDSINVTRANINHDCTTTIANNSNNNNISIKSSNRHKRRSRNVKTAILMKSSTSLSQFVPDPNVKGGLAKQIIGAAKEDGYELKTWQAHNIASKKRKLNEQSTLINNRKNCIIEVCVDNVNSAINALKGGANRLEVCSNLYEGGVTASYGLIQCIMKEVSNNIEVNCLIRPRVGDFVYDQFDVDCMINDIKMCKELKVHGVVFGCLNENGLIDVDVLKLLLSHCKPQLSVTFHRAIDMCKSPVKAVEKLIQLNVDRVLTSGGHNSAREGAQVIKDMVKVANNRIAIMAGGGVKLDNAIDIINECRVKEIHGTFRKLIDGSMKFRKENVFLGNEKKNSTELEYGLQVCDFNIVNGIRQALENANKISTQ